MAAASVHASKRSKAYPDVDESIDVMPSDIAHSVTDAVSFEKVKFGNKSTVKVKLIFVTAGTPDDPLGERGPLVYEYEIGIADIGALVSGARRDNSSAEL